MSPKRKQLVFQLLLLVLTISTCVLLSLLLLIVVKWKQAREEARSPKEQHVCVAINTVTSCKDNFIDDTGDVQKCCGAASVIIGLLLAKYSRDKMDHHLYSTLLTREYCDKTKGFPVAALRDINLQASRENSHLVWKDTPHWCMLRSVENNKGRLQIIHSGYYFVHSQIKLNMNPSESVARFKTPSNNYFIYVDNTETVMYQLYRYSKKHNTARLLLESSETQCDVLGNVSYVTMSMGAAFHLHKGDELFVATSHPRNLVSDYHGNYFGLYKI